MESTTAETAEEEVLLVLVHPFKEECQLLIMEWKPKRGHIAAFSRIDWNVRTVTSPINDLRRVSSLPSRAPPE